MTTQLTELQELEEIYCEMYKDVYGIKARWYQASSVEQARKDLDALQEAGQRVAAEEAGYEKEAQERFEKRVTETIALGAGDRETAMRRIHDAEDTQGDDEHLCYRLGLGYRYFVRNETLPA